MAIPSQDLKQRCTNCGEEKPLNHFYNRSRSAGGRPRPWRQCKECICNRHKKARVQVCTKCGQEKPLRAFYKRSPKRGESHLRQKQCKECLIQASHEHYVANLDANRKANRVYGAKRRAVVKDAVFKNYGGYRCVCCGETEKSFLTLDHIANDGADFRRMLVGTQARGGGYVTYRFLYTHGFPPGFQVLCANCQHGKRMNKGICPHQVRCNDQEKSVRPSGRKRSASVFPIAG